MELPWNECHSVQWWYIKNDPWVSFGVVWQHTMIARDVDPVHYAGIIMITMASQITSLTVVYSIVYSDADQSKHQSSASLAFVWGIHRDRWIPRTKGQLRGKLMTSIDDVIMSMKFHGVIIRLQYWLRQLPSATKPLPSPVGRRNMMPCSLTRCKLIYLYNMQVTFHNHVCWLVIKALFGNNLCLSSLHNLH